MAKRKKTKLVKKEHVHGLENKVLNFFKKHSTGAFNPKQVVRQLDLKGKRRVEVALKAMVTLEQKNYLKQISPTIFQLVRNTNESVVGVVDFVNPRFAFIVTEEMENDIKVGINNINGALHGDVVRCSIFSGRQGANPEGEIIDIVSRVKKQYVGVIKKSKGFAFVIPDSKRMHYDIYLPEGQGKKGFDGDKVIVELTRYPEGDRKPEGKIVQVLGEAGQHNVEMHAILAEFDLPLKFPSKVLDEANAIPTHIEDDEIAKRKDMRGITTFTIDPHDAKDFDDALSIQQLKNGNWEIGVHIADVTHYLKEDSILDQEAFDRATSVYLVDRVVPMLPENLSNVLCSLRPNEDKLTFSVIFEMDHRAKIISEWFGRTIIHSNRRFTYEEAQERIETKEGDFQEEINKLNELALILRKQKFDNGAISFESPEVKFKLDNDGTPLSLITKERKDAHKLIEDFMLLANKKVAEFVFKKQENGKPKTFVYRTHDNPNLEKLMTFAGFALKFGHQVTVHQGNLSHNLNELSQKVQGKPEESVLQQLCIRSMAKAIYTTEPLGHFGLSFDHYSHFTSPIRRYPDVMVHRLLQRYLDGGKSANEDEYENKCKHSSEREKLASDAERASIKYKQVEYMQNMKDTDFEGIITGVQDFGFFVEIKETKCEGMVRLSDMNDYFVYDQDRLTLTGERTGKVISFGDPVVVQVKKTDLQNRTIDLELISHGDE